jgi:hypothetical protein
MQIKRCRQRQYHVIELHLHHLVILVLSRLLNLFFILFGENNYQLTLPGIHWYVRGRAKRLRASRWSPLKHALGNDFIYQLDENYPLSLLV